MSLFKRNVDEENVQEEVFQEDVENVSSVDDQNFTRKERKALKKARRNAPTITDAYDESDRTLSDSEAHRDVSYELPPTIKQIWICYMTQMKRFTKERTVWTMLILLLLIPVFYFVSTKYIGVPVSHITNVFLSVPLFAMPVVVAFICSSTCGTMLPREYNERTIYLSLPLPISRFAFYIGKFLAGFSLCLGVVTAAYGISVLLALTVGNTDVSYTGAMFSSLLVMVCTVFFYCSFVYMLSAKSKRGATLKALVLLMVALPVLVAVPYIMANIDQLESYRSTLEAIGGILLYIPVTGPDYALNILGSSGIAQFFLFDVLSVFSFVKMLSGISLNMNLIMFCLVSIVLGILCLVRGFFKIKRRDM